MLLRRLRRALEIVPSQVLRVRVVLTDRQSLPFRSPWLLSLEGDFDLSLREKLGCEGGLLDRVQCRRLLG